MVAKVVVSLGEVRSLGVVWPGAYVFPFKTFLTRVPLCIVMASEMCYATEFSVCFFDIFPTRCNVTHFISGKLLCMFRVVSPPIIRSTQLYLQYLVFVKPLLLPASIVDELELV